MFSREQIEQQQSALARVNLLRPMRFEASLETVFLDYRYQRLLKRVPAIGFVGLALFTLFSLLDFIFLPADASNITITIRLLLICPLIMCVILFAVKTVNARFFIYFYAFVYVFSGCAIIGIIYTADAYAYSLPYDGILLHLVFGYFLMGLPYLTAIYASLLVSLIYFWISFHMQLPLEQLVSNAIFILSLNFMGAIGGYMQDRARRFLFLNEKLVALAKAKDKKEIAAKTRLVAIASHDLRQPLHAMNMLIEALEAQLTDSAQLTLAKSLNISIKQLSQMLNTLLDISKLNAGIVQAKQEALNLSKKIRDLCEEFAFRAKEAGIILHFEGIDSVYVQLDPVLFDRILRNVIENIFVHAEATDIKIVWQRRQKTVQLVIVDNGKGIAQEDLQHIFDEFQQAGTHSQTGMGLGLSIVKQLAELQNIPYQIESHPGIGTTFQLELTLAPEHVQMTQTATMLAVRCPQGSHFMAHWQSRFAEWGYALTQVHPGDTEQLLDIKALIPANCALLLWEVEQAEQEKARENDAFSLLFPMLKNLPAAAELNLALLLIVEDEALASIWQNQLHQLRTQHQERYPNLKLEVVSKQVRPAKLRLVLSYLSR